MPRQFRRSNWWRDEARRIAMNIAKLPSCSGLIVTFMMRPRPLAQSSKPYPQTDIRRPHRTTRCERNSLSHALTNPPPSNPHHTARTH